MNERLYRSSSDRVIAGVAGGIATWLNIDPSVVLIAWVLLAIFSGGLFVLVYFVMMIVVPLAPPGWGAEAARRRDLGSPAEIGSCAGLGAWWQARTGAGSRGRRQPDDAAARMAGRGAGPRGRRRLDHAAARMARTAAGLVRAADRG